MSGVIKGIKKAFKKVAKFVSKHWKTILIAAAVVFTAGVALAYFAPAAAATIGAAGVPGFGAGGIFTSAATALGGGATAATAGAAGLSAGTTGVTAGLQTTFSGYAAATATATGAWTAPMALPAVAGGGGAVAAAGAMSTFEKIAMLQMGVSTVAGLLKKEPEANPIQRQYGTYDKKGKGPGMAMAFNPATGQVERVSNGQMAFQSSASAPARQEQAATAETQTPEQSLIAQDEGQPANASKSQPEGQELIADADLNPTGGPTLEDRQNSVAQGYKTGDYSGVGA